MSQKEYQLVVMGSGGVGKSTLSVQFIQGQFIDEYDPTIEDSYRKDITVDGETVSLDILDTAGQEEYNAMREQYLRTGQGFLLVFSLTSKASFEEMQTIYKQIISAKNNDSSFPVVVAGNKSDLADQIEVDIDSVKRFCNTRRVPLLLTSAKTRDNVDECFEQLARRILSFEKEKVQTARSRSQLQQASTTHQGAAKPKESSTCCVIV